MLYFANKPDPAFTAILHAALEDMHGMLVDPDTDPADAERYWQAQCPLASKCFPLALAVNAIDRLLVASQDPITAYRITDYHWLLLYDCLGTFCEVHLGHGFSDRGVYGGGPWPRRSAGHGSEPRGVWDRSGACPALR